MSANDNGGAAFPCHESNGNGHLYCSEDGMTLRDYFIAHAPAEPQPWFRPAMPPRPEQPWYRDAPEAVKAELRGSDYEDWLAPEDMTPAAREWHEVKAAAHKAGMAWDAEAEKQRYVQWPAAWADAMLKARAA